MRSSFLRLSKQNYCDLMRGFPFGCEFNRCKTPRKPDSTRRAWIEAEAEAIALAEELHADHLLIDERKGRRLAQQQGVPVVGLIGVVLMAKRAGFIPSAQLLLNELDQQPGVYLTEALKAAALKTVGE